MTERRGQRWHARIETQGCGGLGSSCADCTFQFQQSVEVTASGSGHFHCLRCHVEPIICSTSYGFSSNWTKASIEPQRVSENAGLSFRNENPFFGTTRFHWLPQGHDICSSQVSVAADYSDSVPDSSSYITSNGYHPLEELRDHGRVRDRMLTSAEIARTAVEANNRALLLFPGIVHCEPHEQISWAEFDYVIDDFGDIFFEVYDGQNILQDHGASNPVVSQQFVCPKTALIGMDFSHYQIRKMDLSDDEILDLMLDMMFFWLMMLLKSRILARQTFGVIGECQKIPIGLIQFTLPSA
ncbi:hypothetical protein Sango_0778600 [Sesamum angolense]|uniref:Uncharacterized protein n=1 Tax=Sesamum angolense TaxID=2727404 RepID=A0AAE1X2K5_9LAMI|nr:hypothetical protein Sango_0778600 [Sesamum angolense]